MGIYTALELIVVASWGPPGSLGPPKGGYECVWRCGWRVGVASDDQKPSDFRTANLTCLSNSSLLSLHRMQASMLAPLSMLGSLSMLMTLSKIFSTLCTGDHLSSANSYMFGSSPGECRIDMHTSPFG